MRSRFPAAETDPPQRPLRFRQLLSGLEYCAWFVVALTPLLWIANGPSVTPDQRGFRILVVVVALLTAVLLRIYHWRTSRVAAINTPAPEATHADSPRRLLEEAIRDDPDAASNYLELARLLSAQDRLEDAERTLEVAVEYCAEPDVIRRQLEAVRKRRMARIELLGRREAKRLRRARGVRSPLGRIPWPEALLGVVIAAFFFRLFPNAWAVITAYFGGPVSATAFLANVAVLAILVWIRLR